MDIPKKNSIFSNVLSLVSAHFIARLLRVVYMVIVARMLGPELFGLLSYGQFWQLLFLPVVIFGTGRVLSREIGQNRERGQQLIASTLSLRLVTTLISALICAITGWVLNSEQMIQNIVFLFSFALIARGITVWTQQLFVAFEVNRYILSQEAVFRILELVLGISALMVGGEVIMIVTIHALIWWLQAISGLFIVNNHLTKIKMDWRIQQMFVIVKQGIPSMMISLAIIWFLHAPLVLHPLFSAANTNNGQLALIFQALAIIGMLVNSSSVGMLPVLSRCVLQGKGEEKVYIHKMLYFSLLACGCIGLLGLAYAPWGIKFVFGPGYALAGQLLGSALWMLLPLTIGILLTQLMIAHGSFFQAALCSLGGVFLMIITMPQLVVYYDLDGVLFATAIGMSGWAMMIVTIVYINKFLNLWMSVLLPCLMIFTALVIYLLIKEFYTGIALIASAILLAILILFSRRLVTH